jgi:hypothetical protein
MPESLKEKIIKNAYAGTPIANYYLKDREDSEDVIHDVIFNVFEQLRNNEKLTSEFKNSKSYTKNYINKAIYHGALDRIKEKKGKYHAEIETLAQYSDDASKRSQKPPVVSNDLHVLEDFVTKHNEDASIRILPKDFNALEELEKKQIDAASRRPPKLPPMAKELNPLEEFIKGQKDKVMKKYMKNFRKTLLDDENQLLDALDEVIDEEEKSLIARAAEILGITNAQGHNIARRIQRKLDDYSMNHPEIKDYKAKRSIFELPMFDFKLPSRTDDEDWKSAERIADRILKELDNDTIDLLSEIL